MTSSILFYELYRVTTRQQLVSRGPYIYLPVILRYSKEPMKKLTTFLVSNESSCDHFSQVCLCIYHHIPEKATNFAFTSMQRTCIFLFLSLVFARSTYSLMVFWLFSFLFFFSFTLSVSFTDWPRMKTFFLCVWFLEVSMLLQKKTKEVQRKLHLEIWCRSRGEYGRKMYWSKKKNNKSELVGRAEALCTTRRCKTYAKRSCWTCITVVLVNWT